MAVLSQSLAEAIRGRQVRAGVFTTFTFDPGFFELHVLPLLFDEPFSQVDKVRRIQLEDRLSSVDLAVYYDRSARKGETRPLLGCR
jgi:ABC-type proline/glycine betaine transport system ATPase subunit